MEVKVSCYSGYTYAECPYSFYWQGMEYKVQRVERAWQEPGERHFIIRTEDAKLFKLRYYEKGDRWLAIAL
jgi:hypothetical protein